MQRERVHPFHMFVLVLSIVFCVFFVAVFFYIIWLVRFFFAAFLSAFSKERRV